MGKSVMERVKVYLVILSEREPARCKETLYVTGRSIRAMRTALKYFLWTVYVR